MNEYPDYVKEKLQSTISELSDNRCLFIKNPNSHFIRNRKLPFDEMLKLILSMGAQSLNLELMEYFTMDSEYPSVSAFVQQRDKILPEAFEALFYSFTNSFNRDNTYKGYQLLAVDGSDITIAHNPYDSKTFVSGGANSKGFNQLHLNALYDIRHRVYVDAHIQPISEACERQALIEMISRQHSNRQTVIIADRGYESYNIMEHIKQKGLNFLIRIKDINSTGISSGLTLPDTDEFDVDCHLLATRRQTNQIKQNKKLYKFFPTNQRFDFLPLGSKESYPLQFRILRFPITENSYEVIVTNLSRDDFSSEEIKKMYFMRWGIETAFRELKYAIGLTSFHSKKVAHIHQEIYARLTMYNFCEIITIHVVIKQRKTKYIYQVNFTMAIRICLLYFRYKEDMSPPDVEALIKRNILPVRPGRHDPRKVRFKSAVSFLYRVA